MEIIRLKTVTDKILTVCVLVAQSCLTLCNPMDCRPPGASVQWIFQERVLEWVAIPFSRGSCQPRDETWSPALQADSLPSEPPGKSCQFSDTIKIQLLLRRKLRYTDVSHPRPLFGSPSYSQWNELHAKTFAMGEGLRSPPGGLCWGEPGQGQGLWIWEQEEVCGWKWQKK